MSLRPLSACLVVATLLLPVLSPASAYALGGGGGGGHPPPDDPPAVYFDDAQNRDASGPKTGWDLLSHDGWIHTQDSFTVGYRQNNVSQVGADGHLFGGAGGLNNVWSGSGVLPANSKAVSTLARIKTQYSSGTGYYEYIMTYSLWIPGVNGQPGHLSSGDTTGGIKSYAL